MQNDKIPKLSEEDKQLCDAHITIEECSAALSKLKNNKSPGCDRFPVKFYKFWGNKIQYFVHKSYLRSGQNKMFSTDQKKTYCQLNAKEKALISLIDFEAAFDSINWSFMLKSLQTFNFENSFISWVKTLYTDIESCVTNNGKSSIFFKLERGIRQGCCLSALLFISVAELLAISIRTNKLIHRIKILQDEFKICQLADDTTLFLRDTCSLKLF